LLEKHGVIVLDGKFLSKIIDRFKKEEKAIRKIRTVGDLQNFVIKKKREIEARS